MEPYELHSSSSDPYATGNISSTCFLPCPRTYLNRLVFWTSEKFGWKLVEISDYHRKTMKTTITFDRARAPAATLRRRMRSKLAQKQGTMAFMWTSANDITTAVAV